MNTLQAIKFGTIGLMLAGLADTASAATTTGKPSYYMVWPNTSSTTSDSFYGVSVGGNKVSTGNKTLGAFLHEAFMRKLTVTVEYTPCVLPPPYSTPCFGTITSAVVQSADVP